MKEKKECPGFVQWAYKHWLFWTFFVIFFIFKFSEYQIIDNLINSFLVVNLEGFIAYLFYSKGYNDASKD